MTWSLVTALKNFIAFSLVTYHLLLFQILSFCFPKRFFSLQKVTFEPLLLSFILKNSFFMYCKWFSFITCNSSWFFSGCTIPVIKFYQYNFYTHFSGPEVLNMSFAGFRVYIISWIAMSKYQNICCMICKSNPRCSMRISILWCPVCVSQLHSIEES